MEKIKHVQQFTGMMNTVLAKELLPNDQYTYILNCDISSTDGGKVGLVKNIKGNVSVPVDLPEGDNKTIYALKNEEANKMYYAVWNSNGYHTWFEFDYVSLTVKVIIQCITDTGGEDIWKWEKGKLINSANIIDNNLLYWTMEGHPARKINIKKSIDKSLETGYGTVILDEYTRAYKKAPAFAPTVNYFTNSDLRKNNLYRRLFKFAVRFIYDDNEYSVFSDFSRVAIPPSENVTGVDGVPLENNGLEVKFPTGGMLVQKIELAMQSTTDDKGVYSDWVSIGVFDKSVLGIDNNTEYTYLFYNDVAYLALPQGEVNQQQSDLPDRPKVQEMAYNTLVYGNFYEGFPAVKVDMSTEVLYSDLFVSSGQANVLNNPSITYNLIEHIAERRWPDTWLHTVGEIIVGPDVKAGNIFSVDFINDAFTKTIKSTLNDNAATIASYFRSEFANHPRMSKGGGYVESVEPAGSGSYKFKFRIWNSANRKQYIDVKTSVTPVNYSTLKDTGNSVPNEKLGSSRRYAIRYENEDGKRSLAYTNNEITTVKSINELDGLKKVQTVLTINHKAPEWASRMSVVATKNLSSSNYIQLLIQRVVTASTHNGEQYHDLIIGSLFTYQKIHPNTTLSYEFKKGDRVRLIKNYDNGTWSIPANVVDYEVLNYYEEFRRTVNENIIIDGTSTVKISGTPDSNNIGNNISVDGRERTIVGVTLDGYTLDSQIVLENSSTSNPNTYPAYDIINRGGILRIKIDPSYPINVDAEINKFALVEVYSPGQTFTNIENENYYDIGYKFEVYENDGQFYHRGNLQDQDANQPAKVVIEGFDNYVRNRELITNASESNPQSIITSIEDKSYSDFYNSDLSNFGRPTRIDDSRGVVHFEDRLIWSNNFVEDTKINGLNMFLSTNRVDYNDKYGSVQKILFYEGRLYIFKYLKTGWVPVMGNLIVDNQGQSLIATSTRLLPAKMEYFLWEGGVGNNPESIVKDGNDVYGVSPTSQVFFDIGGAGLIPTSKIYNIDNYAREKIAAATASGAHIFGGINRKKNQYIIMIDQYEVSSYKDDIDNSNSERIFTEGSGSWSIVANPTNGSVSLINGVVTYSPNLNFSGVDQFSYKMASGVTRYVILNVLSEETQTVWHPDGEYCVVTGGIRTGQVAYSMLKQYDNISGTYTGLTKSNTIGDPDYIAPVEDLVKCPIGIEYIYLGSIKRIAQDIEVSFTSTSTANFIIKETNDFSSATISETGVVPTGVYNLNVANGSGNVHLFLSASASGYTDIVELSIKGAYLQNMNFNELSNLLKLVLDQTSIPVSHNNQFVSLSINQLGQLRELRVMGNELTSLDLTSNSNIEILDLRRSRYMNNLIIGNYSKLREVRLHDSLFTNSTGNPALLTSLMNNMNTSSTLLLVLQYGVDNGSGITLPLTMAPVYGSLQGRGVTIIGKPPISPTSTALVTGNGIYIDNHPYVLVSLSSVIPTSVTFTVFFQVKNSSNLVVYSSYVDVVIPAYESLGQYVVTDYTLNLGDEGVAVSAVANPNPAAGVTINFNYTS